MADNERLMRELPFVDDARITIIAADGNLCGCRNYRPGKISLRGQRQDRRCRAGPDRGFTTGTLPDWVMN
ncbi:MAG: hypothetical protein MZV63_61935 [Marinilabiliales bacterium]|nr:hypothetical protein [Marinilabiliales bacterium]